MSAKKKTILIVAAHPDDEILGCGGTMCRLSEEGHSVHILVLGEGITSRQTRREPLEVDRELKRLHTEVVKASRVVGADSAEVLDLPDNRFDSVALLDVIKIIEEKKRKILPEIIFTHHSRDLNIDHQVTFQAVLTACRPVEGQTVKEIYSFEVPSSTDWQVQTSNNTFLPTYYISLSKKHIEAKIRAMQVYSSERRKFPHPRSPKAITSLATYRGTNIGGSYAECFEVVRRII